MPPRSAERENVHLVGYHDLNGRPGFKLAMQEVGGRWYLYMGHIWHQGWSIVDVTEPADPELVTFVEGPDDCWCHQIQVADGLMVTSIDWPRESWQPVDGETRSSDRTVTEGVYLFDVATDPTDPERLAHYVTGGQGTHRNYYDGGDYLYLTASPDGFEGYILTILDVSDPSDPERLSRWWWEGQRDDESSPPDAGFFEVPGFVTDDRDAPVPYHMHGPAYVVDDLAYLSYGRLGMVTLDVSDRSEPEFVSQMDFGGLGSCLGTHSVVPIPESDFVIVNSEAIMDRDGDSLNYTFLVDVADETQPSVVSSMPLPTPEDHLPYRNYYEKGARFGPHNQHHYQNQPCLWKTTDLIFMTYFNAGLRVFDVSDPLAPTEAGYYVPEAPRERVGTVPDTLVTQFEDVLVDARGYIYCTDKNHGLFVLQHDLDFAGYQ